MIVEECEGRFGEEAQGEILGVVEGVLGGGVGVDGEGGGVDGGGEGGGVDGGGLEVNGGGRGDGGEGDVEMGGG